MSRGNWLREVIHIEFDFFDTGLVPRMVFCCLPRAIEQLHVTEILYCEATPVIRSTDGLETAFAVASVLVAQHLEASMFIPAQ